MFNNLWKTADFPHPPLYMHSDVLQKLETVTILQREVSRDRYQKTNRYGKAAGTGCGKGAGEAEQSMQALPFSPLQDRSGRISGPESAASQNLVPK